MKVTNITAMNIKPAFGEFSGQLFRVGNRDHTPDYLAGTSFEVDFYSPSGGMEIIDPEGKRLLVPFGEVQSFENE